MSLSVNTKTYTANKHLASAVVFAGPSASLSDRDDIVLSVVEPKPVSTFSGVGRARAKLTRTLTLTGALSPTSVASFQVDVVVPVGFSGTDVDALVNDFAAWLATADFKSLVKNQKISF